MQSTKKRLRLTVPVEDASVLRWIDAQQNLSYSLRQLIRDAIRRDGYVDATCGDVQQLPRRGRPSKEDSEPAYAPEPQAAEVREKPAPAPAAAKEEPARRPAPVRQEKQSQEPATDEDGFVDPESFF